MIYQAHLGRGQRKGTMEENMKDSKKKKSPEPLGLSNIADLIMRAVKEEAGKTYNITGRVSAWRVSRNLGLTYEEVKSNLIKLGYIQKSTGTFVLKGDREGTPQKV